MSIPLQITSQPLDPCQVELTIVVPPERLANEINALAQEVARKQRIKGYRPGKVPVQRVIDMVGEEVLRNGAAERLERRVALEAMRAEELIPVAPIMVETTGHDPLTIRAVVPLTPEIDLGDYRALRLDLAEPPPIADEALDTQIDAWRHELAELTPVTRPAEAEDVARLAHLIGRRGDTVVFDLHDMELPLTPEGATAAGLPPPVVDGIIGLARGQRGAFEVKYSEMWPEARLQGQTVEVEVEVEGVSARVQPTAESLAERFGAPSLDALREQLRAQLTARAHIEAREALADQAIGALADQAAIRYPPALLEAEMMDVIADLRQRVERQGFDWERWIALQGKDEESLVSELERQAELRLRHSWAMIAFAEAEDIQLDRSELEAAVNQFNTYVSAEPGRKRVDQREIRRRLGSRILSGRALGRLLAIVTGEADDSGAPPPIGAFDQPVAPVSVAEVAAGPVPATPDA